MVTFQKCCTCTTKYILNLRTRSPAYRIYKNITLFDSIKKVTLKNQKNIPNILNCVATFVFKGPSQ